MFVLIEGHYIDEAERGINITIYSSPPPLSLVLPLLLLLLLMMMMTSMVTLMKVMESLGKYSISEKYLFIMEK